MSEGRNFDRFSWNFLFWSMNLDLLSILKDGEGLVEVFFLKLGNEQVWLFLWNFLFLSLFLYLDDLWLSILTNDAYNILLWLSDLDEWKLSQTIAFAGFAEVKVKSSGTSVSDSPDLGGSTSVAFNFVNNLGLM